MLTSLDGLADKNISMPFCFCFIRIYCSVVLIVPEQIIKIIAEVSNTDIDFIIKKGLFNSGIPAYAFSGSRSLFP